MDLEFGTLSTLLNESEESIATDAGFKRFKQMTHDPEQQQYEQQQFYEQRQYHQHHHHQRQQQQQEHHHQTIEQPYQPQLPQAVHSDYPSSVETSYPIHYENSPQFPSSTLSPLMSSVSASPSASPSLSHQGSAYQIVVSDNETLQGEDGDDEVEGGEEESDQEGEEEVRQQESNLPQNLPSPDTIDKLIAKDLNAMTLEERERCLYDIHGVSKLDSEQATEEFLLANQNILEMEISTRMIDTIRSTSLSDPSSSLQNWTASFTRNNTSTGFQLAWTMSPDYVRSLYPMFLRSDEFKVKDAAERLNLHFDLKLQLFGREKLCKNITMDDLNEDDLACLEHGFWQILPTRDRAGRTVFCKIPYHQKYKARINVWRSNWYIAMTALQDQETQKRGVVCVVYNINSAWQMTFDLKLVMFGLRTTKAMPFRVAAVHYCFADPTFASIVSLINSFSGPRLRSRTRLHQGTHGECMYALLSYGIPVKELPVHAETGNLQRKQYHTILRGVQKQEMIFALQKREQEQEQRRQRQLEQLQMQQQQQQQQVQRYRSTMTTPETSALLNNDASSFAAADAGGNDDKGRRQQNTRDNNYNHNSAVIGVSTCASWLSSSWSLPFSSSPRSPSPPMSFVSSSSTTSSSSSSIWNSSNGNGSNTIGDRNDNTRVNHEFILIPSRNDVLFGRGKPLQNHVGNVRLMYLIQENKVRHSKADRVDKNALVEAIVLQIQQEGGRFLKKQQLTPQQQRSLQTQPSNNGKKGTKKKNSKDGSSTDGDGMWVQVPYKQAFDKVSHGFRNCKLPSSSSSSSATNKKKKKMIKTKLNDDDNSNKTNETSSTSTLSTSAAAAAAVHTEVVNENQMNKKKIRVT